MGASDLYLFIYFLFIYSIFSALVASLVSNFQSYLMCKIKDGVDEWRM